MLTSAFFVRQPDYRMQSRYSFGSTTQRTPDSKPLKRYVMKMDRPHSSRPEPDYIFELNVFPLVNINISNAQYALIELPLPFVRETPQLE